MAPWILLLCLTATQAAPPRARSPCDLACWLNFTIAIPDQSFARDGFNLSLIGMNCKGNQIGGINSTFAPPTTLGLFLYGIGTTCEAQWEVREIKWPHITLSGNVEAAVSGSSLYLEMTLVKGPDGLADSALVTECSTNALVSLTFSGGITSTILELFEGLIESFVQAQLDAVSCKELSSLINVNLTTALQQVDATIRPYLEPIPIPTPLIPPGTFQLMGNPLVGVVTYAVQGLLGPHGPLYINKLADRFTNNTGSFSVPPEWLERAAFSVPVSGAGNLTLGISSASVNGLNTWGAVDLFAVTNYSMGVHTEMDLFNLSVTFFVNVTAPWIDQYLYEEGELVVTLSHNNLNAAVQLALKEGVVKSLKPEQLISVGCIRSAIDEASLVQLFVNMSVDRVGIIALSGNLEKELDATINNILALFTTSFGTAIPAFVNSFGASMAMREINSLMAGELESLNGTCDPPEKPKPTFNFEGTVGAFSGAGAVFVSIIFALLFAHARHRWHKEDHKLEVEPLLAVEHKRPTPSLAMDPQIPILIRLGIPLLLLVNIALFISSNTSVGASIYLFFTVNGLEIKSPSLFSFSLANTIRDMWHAKVYPLALLIAVFSGAWPYLKLVLMLFCWMAPAGALKAKTREKFLMVLDTLGKWSLVDAFVLTLMVVAFRFHIAYPFSSGGSDYNPVVDVFVVPDWGFYTFLLATMTSLALTHLILAFHHASVASREDHPSPAGSRRKPLSARSFRANKTDFACTRLGRFLITVLLFASACLLSLGAYFESFDFRFEGAAGYVLEAVGDSATTHYSVITLGAALPESSRNPNSPGIRWIQATYFTFTIAVPLAHLIVLTFLWLVPLKSGSQRRIFVVTEILDAWSAMEVFVVSIIAAVLEIQQFAKFIIGNKCDLVNEILRDYFHNEFGKGDVCFEVVATLNKGCWILFAACVFYLVAGNVIMKVCHAALQNRRSPGRPSSDGHEGHRKRRSLGFFTSLLRGLRLITEDTESARQEETVN